MNPTFMNPFSGENLNFVFKLHAKNPLRVISREGRLLEFKETFNWGSKDKYIKTIAAFANTKGGYLIFGVKDSPRDIIGLTSESFEKLEVEKVTEFINSAFSPEIKWDIHSYEIAGKKIGLIYVFESNFKPIMAKKTIGQEIRESDIFYRYHGRSERIKFPELRNLLEKEKEKEKRLWMKHVEKIARTGVSNVGIFDTIKGEVTGARGSFLINEDLLDKLKFIKEGMFSQIEGAPTLRLVGDLQTVGGGIIQPIKRVVQHRAIQTPDIIYAFLDQEKVREPLQYVKQICFENSAYLPVYFFIKLSKLTIPEIIEQLNNVKSRLQTKDKIKNRLSSEEDFAMGSMDVKTDAAAKRRNYISQICTKALGKDIPEDELKYFFQAITHLSQGEFQINYLFPIIKELFNEYYEKLSSNDAGLMRKAICHLDLILFGG